MNEINKLHDMLLKANIPHTFRTMNNDLFGADALQICLYQDNTFQKELDDVVFHRFSHGHEMGLLETYKLGNCEGFETAEQIFKGWMEMFF